MTPPGPGARGDAACPNVFGKPLALTYAPYAGFMIALALRGALKGAPATRAGSLVSSERLDARLPPRPEDAAPANAGGGPGGSAGHIRSLIVACMPIPGPGGGPKGPGYRGALAATNLAYASRETSSSFARVAPVARVASFDILSSRASSTPSSSFRVRAASAPFRVGTSSRVFAAVSVSIACVRAKETARVVRPSRSRVALAAWNARRNDGNRAA